MATTDAVFDAVALLKNERGGYESKNSETTDWWTDLQDTPVRKLTRQAAYSLGYLLGRAESEGCTLIEFLDGEGLL